MITEAFLQEFERESATTRKVLERIPQDRLSWKPHAKSMSLGTLAHHIAAGPGILSGWALQDKTEMSPDMGSTPEATSTAAVLATHDDSVDRTKAALTTLGDAGLMADWKLTTKDGATIMGMPKVALIRSVVLNHMYHHRGQLSVYLRLLDVPVPSIYGPSADENPFTPTASA
ncbi:MAG: DinB family protein [Acidobacteriota bacterium]